MNENLARSIKVYKNGDRYYEGHNVVISRRNCRNFDTLLRELTEVTHSYTQVRRIYTPASGTRITTIDALSSGDSYVCGGLEKFRKLDYSKIEKRGWKFTGIDKNRRAGSGRIFLGTHEKAAQPLKSISPLLITVYRNGDAYFIGHKILLNRRTAQSFDQVLSDLTDSLHMNYACRRLYSIDGARIVSLSSLLGNGGDQFVAGGLEKFKKISYGENKLEINRQINRRREKAVTRSYLTSDVSPTRFGAGFRPADGSELNRKANTLLEETDHADAHAASERQRQKKKIQSKLIERKQRRTEAEALASEFEDDAERLQKHIVSEKKRQLTTAAKQMEDRKKLPKYEKKKGDQLLNDSKVLPPIQTTAEAEHIDDAITETFMTIDDVESKYEIGNMLGEGNFAIVKKGRNKETGEDVALKIISKAKCDNNDSMLDNEVTIMRLCDHPNIIRLIETFDTQDEFYLIMELVPGGDLFDRIVDRFSYSEQDAATLLYDIASAVNYLHSHNIVHRDLKPENCLVVIDGDTGNEIVKLGDFGLARSMESTSKLFTVCGTPTYVAPEILSQTGYGCEVDNWAIGCILYIMLSGCAPFENDDQEELFCEIEHGQVTFDEECFADISQSARELVLGLLTVDPNNRITATGILAHPWTLRESARTEDIHEKIAPLLQKNFNAKANFKGAVHAIAMVGRFNKISKAVDLERNRRKDEELEKIVNDDNVVKESELENEHAPIDEKNIESNETPLPEPTITATENKDSKDDEDHDDDHDNDSDDSDSDSDSDSDDDDDNDDDDKKQQNENLNEDQNENLNNSKND